MNTCTFTGRLAADAEMKTAKSGTALCSFRIASDVGFGDQKKTHWLSCVIFGDRGSKLQPYLRKGDPLTVVGELSPPRIYESNGETRTTQDLVVRDLALQGAKGDSGNQDTHTNRQTSQSTNQLHNPNFDEDIPF